VLGGTLYNARYAYVANAGNSTASKISLETGEEVARYNVGLYGVSNSPSRTGIDSRGDAYVASRAFSNYASVTKIAGDESNCYDRDRDGSIETSEGPTDVRAYGDDECVLWTTRLPYNCVARALTVDRDDRAWVGCYNLRRFYVLEPGDGSIIRSVDVNLHPYGAAISSDGLLWFPNGCCGRQYIQSINTETYALNPYIYNGVSCGSYGIAVDWESRVMIGGYPYGCLSRYDPSDATWEKFDTAASTGYVRGVTIDALGNVWAASHYWGGGPHWMTRWNEDGGERVTYTLIDTDTGTSCGVPIGIGSDHAGNMWTPCQSTSNVAQLDPDTGRVTVRSGGPGPYTYSDFTGFLRANVTAPEGAYVRIYQGWTCDDDRVPFWSSLYYDADAPEGTAVTFYGRTGPTGGLGTATELTLAEVPGSTSPARVATMLSENGVDNGLDLFEVRVRLQASEDEQSPTFRNMDMEYYCVCSCNTGDACQHDPPENPCECDEDCR